MSYGTGAVLGSYFVVLEAATTDWWGFPIFWLWNARPGWPRSVAERPARAWSGRAKISDGEWGRFNFGFFTRLFSIAK